jgi:hypothetical protein
MQIFLCTANTGRSYFNLASAAGIASPGRKSQLYFVLVFLNDIHDVISRLSSSSCVAKVEYTVYADDISIFIRGKNIKDSAKLLNRILSRLSTWLSSTGQIVNVEKTKVMCISLRSETRPPIWLGRRKIDYVESSKLLGVVIDSKLSFNLHVQHVTSRMRLRLSYLQRIHAANALTLKRIYVACILPVATFSSAIWCKAMLTSRHASSIEMIHARACKFILGVPKTSCNASSLTLEGLPSLTSIIAKSSFSFVIRANAVEIDNSSPAVVPRLTRPYAPTESAARIASILQTETEHPGKGTTSNFSSSVVICGKLARRC